MKAANDRTWRMSSLRVFSPKPRTVMSSIMRARSGLTGRSTDWEVIGGSSRELKVAGPSMLGSGRPGSHALPLTPPKTHGPSRASLPRERVRSLPHSGRSRRPRLSHVLPKAAVYRCGGQRRVVARTGSSAQTCLPVEARTFTARLSAGYPGRHRCELRCSTVEGGNPRLRGHNMTEEMTGQRKMRLLRYRRTLEPDSGLIASRGHLAKQVCRSKCISLTVHPGTSVRARRVSASG